MIGRLRQWIFGSGGAENLPDRVRDAIRQQQAESEILIGWAQLVLVLLLAVAYETTTMAGGVVQEDYSFDDEVFLLYGAFATIRLVLAYRRRLPAWFLYVSALVDVALLMGLVYFLHYKYAQPAVFYLKAPLLLYVFLLIALRTLRFEARFVLVTGFAAAAAWIWLVYYALSGEGGPPNRTGDFVEYMTSNAFLVQAEAEKLFAIVLTTLVMAIAIARARRLLVRSVAEGVAARDLSRFFDPGVAARIRGAAMSIRAGEGELRDVAILTVDLRGFTTLSTTLAPDQVMKVLQDYQSRVCPLIAGHGGSIDKFLGDGILASFGAVVPSATAAADALRAADAVIGAVAGWADDRRKLGQKPLEVGLAIASGRVVFGAVGDAERLEFTVIGEAVNLAAKLEKHNKQERTQAVVDGATYDLACQQGYKPPRERERRMGRAVAGVAAPMDIVVLA
ncbi:MAG: adenylate/guanylate cyclase domain-containing protein [Reyranellaceae bacterium]